MEAQRSKLLKVIQLGHGRARIIAYLLRFTGGSEIAGEKFPARGIFRDVYVIDKFNMFRILQLH